MRVPNKVNTKPFERLLKWKRKKNIFDFKERRRKGEKVLFMSVRRKNRSELSAFLSRKRTSKQDHKGDFSVERKRGSKPNHLLLSPIGRESRMGKRSYWHSTTRKRQKRAMKWLFFCLFFTTHQQDMCFQTERCSK